MAKMTQNNPTNGSLKLFLGGGVVVGLFISTVNRQYQYDNKENHIHLGKG
jgi:hypothetical protein